jgi:hypothetical protein
MKSEISDFTRLLRDFVPSGTGYLLNNPGETAEKRKNARVPDSGLK